MTINGDTVRNASVTKANDQALGLLTSYALEPQVLDIDGDGQPYGTWIVAPQSIDAPPLQPGTPASRHRRLSDRQRLALDALAEVTLAAGEKAPAAFGLPAAVRAVPAEAWRIEMERRQILGEDAAATRKRWPEVRDALQARHLIGVRDRWVWDAR